MSPRRTLACTGLLLLVWAAVALGQKEDLNVTIDEVKPGNHIFGPATGNADFKGKVVLIEVWSTIGQPSLVTIPNLVKWQDELGSFGLVVVGFHLGETPLADVRTKAKALKINFTVTEGGFIKAGTISIPHVSLFDHTGKCIYRGAPAGAEAPMRAAVGAYLTDLGQPAKSKTVVPLLDGLKKGQVTPLATLQRALPLLKSADAATAEDAKLLVAKLSEAGTKRIEQAEALLTAAVPDPVEAYNQVEKVPNDFKGTPVADKATALLATLKKDKVVAEELKARPSLESIRKIDAALAPLAAKLDPKDPTFQRTNAFQLANLKNSLAAMQKTYPNAKATEEAVQIAFKYGVAGK